jgi:poly(3-hydroxybutyrate) depolymerase
MKKCRSYLKLLMLFVLTFSNINAQNGVAGEFMSLTHTYKGITLPYRLYLPQNYSPFKKYPLLLSLHGAGENGTDNSKPLTSTFLATYWAEKNIQKKHPCLVVVPQLPNGMFWYQWMFGQNENGNYLEAANNIIDALIKQYSSIDQDRLYAIGFSMGGVACWQLASHYPKRFAAIVPISGTNLDQSVETESQTTPTWIFSGRMDDIFPALIYYNFVTKMINLGQAVVFPQCRFGVYSATECLSTAALLDNIDRGATFIFSEYDGLGHSNTVTEVAYQDSLLSRWLFKQHKAPVASIEINDSKIPDNFSLFQNFPNPFNPTTVIKYSVPALIGNTLQSVTLKVFDLLGREVATIVDEIQTPGNYSKKLDASSFSSGTYYYTLTTARGMISKKMILMK